MTDAERRKRIGDAFVAIGDVFVLPEHREERMAGRAAFFHAVHLRDLFECVIMLLNRHRAHGAFILGRSMFETSLMLGAMENPTTRDGIAIRWFQDSHTRAPRFVRAVANVTHEEVSDAEEIIRAGDRALAAAQLEIGVEKLPNSLHVENEAKTQGREEDLPNYIIAHEFTHGAYAALKSRAVHDGDEERSHFYVDQEHRLDVQEAAANFAGRLPGSADLPEHPGVHDAVPEGSDRRHVGGPEQSVRLHVHGQLASVAAFPVPDPADVHHAAHCPVRDL